VSHDNFLTSLKEKAQKEQAILGTILVVDDSPTVCKLVAITLERHGYQVVAAANGLEALAKMSEGLPDLILLDITMPRMDGYQLCKIIKGSQETRHIPVVMLTGKDGFFDKVRGRMVGSTEYITKPFEPDTLLRLVEKHANC
jgi:twitching motility two-component system response regulator PilG